MSLCFDTVVCTRAEFGRRRSRSSSRSSQAILVGVRFRSKLKTRLFQANVSE
jgi:hypothetical protein